MTGSVSATEDGRRSASAQARGSREHGLPRPPDPALPGKAGLRSELP